jgi:hypothetical protein
MATSVPEGSRMKPVAAPETLWPVTPTAALVKVVEPAYRRWVLSVPA